jgi:7-cyano-7-deazaguanine reductase
MDKETVKHIEDMPLQDVNKQQNEVMQKNIYSIAILEYIQIEKTEIIYSTTELVALCPMTGLLDFYELHLKYVPFRNIPELKSLKMYLSVYKEIGILHEHLAQKVLKDFCDAVKPDSCELRLKVNVRGGILTEIICTK